MTRCSRGSRVRAGALVLGCLAFVYVARKRFIQARFWGRPPAVAHLAAALRALL